MKRRRRDRSSTAGARRRGPAPSLASVARASVAWAAFALATPALVGGCSPAVAADEREAIVLAGPAPFEVKARSEWPTAAWPRARPEEVGLDPEALARLEDYLFARHGDDVDRRGQRTNAFVLIKDGKLVAERYARGYTAETPLLTWSVSKSIGGTLVGLAVADGKLDVNDPIGKHYPPADRDGVREIRVVDLLRMSSGLDWNETYETSPIFSSVMAMLYTAGRDDMAAYVASHDLAVPPGTRWSYSSGDSNLLSGVVRGAIGDEAYAEFPWRRLFDKIGMRSAVLERDKAGTYVTSSYLYASAQDLARWAFLYLNDGVWEGERLLPEGWVAFTLTMAPSYYDTALTPGTMDDNPGAQVYLNLGDPKRDVPAPWPMAPADTFAAQGHWGKSIFVFPGLDMIAVRLGDDRRYACDIPGNEDRCEPDRTKAYSKPYYLELLMAAVKR